LLIKDLYHGLIAPKMQVQRQDWDNLSDDVCYINPDHDAQARAGDHERGRQKKKTDLTEIEEEDVPDEDEWELGQKVVPRDSEPDGGENAATANDTEKAEDSGPSDEAMRKQWKTVMDERKKSRTCFQYRWHDEVCCTARSFKLGAPKAKPDHDKQMERWVSGWDLKGINDWISAMGECTEVAWKTPES
jgi:hypothetical protein